MFDKTHLTYKTNFYKVNSMYLTRKYIKFDLQVYSECFPHIDKYRVEKIFRKITKSVLMDCVDPERLDLHDKLFEPRTEYEEKFWKSCRQLAKEDMRKMLASMENGKKGGRPLKENS